MIKEKISFFCELNHIQQDNADVRNGINKSVATIPNKGGVSVEQVFYISFFGAVFISIKSSLSLYFDQLLE